MYTSQLLFEMSFRRAIACKDQRNCEKAEVVGRFPLLSYAALINQH